MFWKLAKALFEPVIHFFTDLNFPGFDDLTFFDVFIGVMLIDVVISVVFIIMGVSSGSGDLPAAITYDYLDDNYGISSKGIQSSRSRKPNYTSLKAQMKADYMLYKMRRDPRYASRFPKKPSGYFFRK